MINTTYIYFIHKGDNIPCYIGKTVNITHRSKHHKAMNKEYTHMEILDEVPSTEWKFWEEWYIQLFLSWGFTLENKTLTGRGPGIRPCLWKDKISKTLIMKNISGPVFQYDKKGNFIKKWEAACIAEDYFNSKDRRKCDNIRACIRGNQKTAYGFIWKN
jgi:hypothetical protein